MRVSRAGWIGVCATALAGLLAALTATAAGFTISQPTTTTQGVSTATATGTTTSTLTVDEINAALAALGSGAKTVGGPGTFLAGVGGATRIYEVLGPAGVNVCATVRNLSTGEIRLSPNTSSSVDVLPYETRSVCVAAAIAIQLICRQGTVCEAVWRIDRW